MKEGDKNTKFFQRTANAHKRYNNIDQLVVNGITLEDPAAIKGEIVRFYQHLFTESEFWRPNFNMVDGPPITNEEKEWLQRPFGEQEVHECLKLCAIDKSPDPDGFTVLLIKAQILMVLLWVSIPIVGIPLKETYCKLFRIFTVRSSLKRA